MIMDRCLLRLEKITLGTAMNAFEELGELLNEKDKILIKELQGDIKKGHLALQDYVDGLSKGIEGRNKNIPKMIETIRNLKNLPICDEENQL